MMPLRMITNCINGSHKMSYAHTQRRKLIRRLKDKYGSDKYVPERRMWFHKFREICAQAKRDREGPPLGSLQDLRDAGLI